MNTELDTRLAAIEAALQALLAQTAKPPLTTFQKVEKQWIQGSRSWWVKNDEHTVFVTPWEVRP